MRKIIRHGVFGTTITGVWCGTILWLNPSEDTVSAMLAGFGLGIWLASLTIAVKIAWTFR